MKLFFKICFLALIFSVFSCGKNSDKSNQDINTIKFWHFWSEPNQKIVIKNLVEEFEKENNYKVELTELSWNDGKTKLFAAFNAKNAPDVLELGSDWVAQFSSSGVLMNLDTLDIDINKYIPFSHQPCYWKNSLFALPWIVDTRVLFYNKDLIANNNESFTDIDKLLKKAEDINGKKGIYGWGATGSDRHRLYKKVVSFLWSYGGDIIDNAGNPILNSENNIKAIEKYTELSRAGIIETQRQLDASFVEGKIAFWISGGWLLEKIKNENPNLNYGVSLVPGVEGSNGISFAGGEYLAINSQTKNQKLALKFIKFMTDGKNSIKFCKSVIEAGFPADINNYQDEFYKSQPDRMVFSKQLEFAKMTPVHPKWLDLEAIIEDAAVEVMFGKLSAREALNKAQEKALEIIQ
jgi:ABC-type glycerol-3-phosphate transport system substrate-binding protein